MGDNEDRTPSETIARARKELRLAVATIAAMTIDGSTSDARIQRFAAQRVRIMSAVATLAAEITRLTAALDAARDKAERAPSCDCVTLRRRLAELREEQREIAALFGIAPCDEDRPPTWTNGERGWMTLREALRPFAAALDGVRDDARITLRQIADFCDGEARAPHSAVYTAVRALEDARNLCLAALNDEPMDAARARSLTCTKAEHIGDGFLHAANDDGPYDVDGIQYCGRCHGLEHPPASSDPTARTQPEGSND